MLYIFVDYIFTSLLIWLFMFLFLYQIITLIPTIKNKPYHIKLSITQAILSSLHGFICGITGLLIMIKCSHNVMKAESFLVLKYVNIGSGYMVYDIVAMYFVHSAIFIENRKDSASFLDRLKYILKTKALIIFHHLVLVFILYPVLLNYCTIGNFFIGCFYSMELSSVFVNLRVILSKLDHKNSNFYFFNGLFMIFTFFLVRVLIFPFMFIVFVHQQSVLLNISYGKAFAKIPLKCLLSSILVLALQIHWLLIMIKGAIKLSNQRFSSNDQLISDKCQ